MMQVLVVDDQTRARQSLKALLATCCQIEVHEATSGAEAIALVSQVQPDIVLMDIDMPEKNMTLIPRGVIPIVEGSKGQIT